MSEFLARPLETFLLSNKQNLRLETVTTENSEQDEKNAMPL